MLSSLFLPSNRSPVSRSGNLDSLLIVPPLACLSAADSWTPPPVGWSAGKKVFTRAVGGPCSVVSVVSQWSVTLVSPSFWSVTPSLMLSSLFLPSNRSPVSRSGNLDSLLIVPPLSKCNDGRRFLLAVILCLLWSPDMRVLIAAALSNWTETNEDLTLIGRFYTQETTSNYFSQTGYPSDNSRQTDNPS